MPLPTQAQGHSQIRAAADDSLRRLGEMSDPNTLKSYTGEREQSDPRPWSVQCKATLCSRACHAYNGVCLSQPLYSVLEMTNLVDF